MSNYETAERKRNITVGVFVLIALCAFGWIIYRFGDLPITVSRFRSFQVFVQFPSAPGVQKDTPVQLTGYRIGRVTDVMAPQIREDKNTGQKYHQTLVVLSIDKKYANIPSSVKVKLMTRGLGSSYIELTIDPAELDKRDPNQPFLVDKMLLQGDTGMTSEFFPEESQKKLEEVVDNFSALIKNINDIIGDKESKDNIKATLANISTASGQAIVVLEKVERFFVTGINTSDELYKTLIELRLILEKVNSGQGSVARLLNDGHFYENLLESTEQIEILLQQWTEFMKKVNEKNSLPIKLK